MQPQPGEFCYPDMESILRHLDFQRPEILKLFSKLGTERAYTFKELEHFSGLSKSETIQILNDLLVEGYIKTRINRKREYYYLNQPDIFFHQFKVNEEPFKLPLGMKYSRHCYHHLAGWLGVKLENGLVKKKYIIPENGRYQVTEDGWKWLEQMGIKQGDLDSESPNFSRQCLDFSERKNHVGGHLGDALLKAMVHKKWVVPVENSREMKLTTLGKSNLSLALGIQL